MYLRLGKTEINYTSSKNDFIVFSEVVNPGMGYESPVLVRSVDQLDAWFGQDFPSRNYFRELLSQNVTLYLGTPLSLEPTERRKKEAGWIDLGKYKVYGRGADGKDTVFFISPEEFPKMGEPETLYLLWNPTLTKAEEWIWTDLGYIPVSDLPQNLSPGEYSKTRFNRDTLTVCKPGEEIEYYHPSFSGELEDWVGSWNKGIVRVREENLENESESLAFILRPGPKTFDENQFWVVPATGPERDITLLCTSLIPQQVVSQKYYNQILTVSNLPQLKLALEDLGWEVREQGKEWVILSPNPIPVTWFWNWPGMEIEPAFDISQAMVSSIPDLKPILRLWSRTCGRPRDPNDSRDSIKVTIEKSTENLWRLKASRYNYEEIFEGYLTDSPSRLDYVIESSSILLHAEKEGDGEELPEGTWELRGAVKEKGTKEGAKEALREMFGQDSNIYPDLVLIPDLSLYAGDREETEKVYREWLEISKEFSVQFLIQNTPENLEWNLTNDGENRLVWFSGTIYLGENPRPGYYIFVKGLLEDNYSMETSRILYNLGLPEPAPYSLRSLRTEELLKLYKSNYLVYNNQFYFYKEYFNGDSFSTSVWMRFVMGKITRELEKHKWTILGHRILGEILENVRGKMGNIKNRFRGIIRSITIDDYNVNWKSQYLNLTISTTISDLATQDMTLDITLNYNKLN